MLAETLRWWLVIGVVGLVALPIALVLFRSLPGRGIAFAKPLGLLLTGYIFWLLLSLNLMPNRPGTIVWALIALLLVDYFILRRNWQEHLEALKDRWRFVLVVEVVFLLGLLVAAHIRAFIPEIQGTEKPMDFLMLNTAYRSASYPPDDPWLAGYGVSYYYFGYVIHAITARLAIVTPSVAYNLGVASTAALAATAALGLAYELVRSVRVAAFQAAIAAGVGAILLVTVLGNLQGVLEFAAANGVLPSSVERAVDIANLERAGESDACLTPVVCIAYPTEESSFWWWWRATRISPDGGTITEFPFFSFILGDLHPHVMAIPFVFTAFALGVAFWRRGGRLALDTWRANPPLLLLSSLLVGGLAFLNTWDLPTLGFLIALLVLARNLLATSRWQQAARETAGFLGPLFALAFLLYAPFYFGFSSQAGFVDAVQGSATTPMQAFLFWTPLFVLALPVPVYLLWKDRDALRGRPFRLAMLLPAFLLVAWVLLLLVRHGPGAVPDAIVDRGANWLTTAFLAAALVAAVLALWRAVVARGDENRDLLVPVLAAMTTALLLVFGAEFFFITDVFGSRLNTVFKFYYQAWLLLGVAGAAGIWYLLSRLSAEPETLLRQLRIAWVAAAAVIVAAALLYPLGATLSRTEGLARSPRTLDGLAFAAEGMTAQDYHLARWLRDNANPGDIIVEASGSSYTLAGRVAAWSGVPTVLAWRGHQVQWGRSNEVLNHRNADVDEVYRTTSLEEAIAILQQYDVTYVVVGSLERLTYPAEALQKFETGLQPVASSGNAVLYRLPPRSDAPVEPGAEAPP